MRTTRSPHFESPQLLSAKDLAAALSLSRRQVFRLNACGKLPAPVRIGGSVRWVGDEISQWILAGCPERQEWQTMRGADHD